MEIAKTRHTRVHGDIALPSPSAPCLSIGVYRGGASHTPRSIPFVAFYKQQGLRWSNSCSPHKRARSSSHIASYPPFHGQCNVGHHVKLMLHLSNRTPTIPTMGIIPLADTGSGKSVEIWKR